MGQIGSDANLAVPALIIALEDEKLNVRRAAAEALGQIGSDAQLAVPALITALEDENPNIRTRAVFALGQIGSDAQLAVPALITALEDENRSVGHSAAFALGQIGIKERDVASQISTIFLDESKNICNRYRAFKLLQDVVLSEAISVIEQNRRTIDYIHNNISGECTRSYLRIKEDVSNYKKNKNTLICNIPIIKNVLPWKCSELKE